MKKFNLFFKKRRILSRLNILLITIEVLIISFLAHTLGNIFYHIDIKHLISILFHELNDDETFSYIIGIWQVQVMIAILVITIVALIIPRLENRVYGLELSRVLMLSRWWKANYYDYISICILLAATNIIFIGQKDINAVIMMFVFTIIIILYIIKRSIYIITMDKESRKITKQYIIQEVIHNNSSKSEELLDNVVKHTILLIKDKRYAEAEKNIELFLEIIKMKDINKDINIKIQKVIENQFLNFGSRSIF